MSGERQIREMQKLWDHVDHWMAETGNRDRIEQSIWNEFGATKAIMFTDMSRFSRITRELGIIHFLSLIRESHKIHLPILKKYSGFLIKIIADDLVVAFDSTAQALSAAVEMHRALKQYNETAAAEFQIGLKIGIETGKILLLQQTDFFGSAVNIASKLGEDLAESGEILVGPTARSESGFPQHLFSPVTGEISGMHLEYYKLAWEQLPIPL
ncbi:MAG: adenylate/guanylate cyclase domain-containing protein [Candidatus Wallbacteria bacterium]|nr:adenylate/guanylate cyclase domain-containing protein [Candidatus Wallbacteria bacterium]